MALPPVDLELGEATEELRDQIRRAPIRDRLDRSDRLDHRADRSPSPVRSTRELMARIVPTEYERRSCAGIGPRLRAMEIREHRKDPKVRLGDDLSSAAANNDAEKVQSLLEQGADPNHIHFTLDTSHPLCRTKSAAVAKLLIAHPQIDVNAKDMNDYSILANWVLHNRSNVELVATILQHPDLDVHAKCPLQIAARFASIEMISLLLEHPNLDINDSCGLLHSAMKRTDPVAVDLAAWLLQHDTLDINLRREDGTTALMHLSGTDSLVIEIGENEHVKRQQIAARQVDMLKMLLPRPDLEVHAVDSKGSTALHHFSAAGRSDLVELLLQDPRSLPSLMQHNSDGLSPLDAVMAEKNRGRKPWDPKPRLAKYDEVIALLTKAAEQKKKELEKLCPAELSKHPGTWSMALDSLM